MKRLLPVFLALAIVPVVTAEIPQHERTDFFSNEDISHGEDITFGVQYRPEDKIDSVVASLYQEGQQVDRSLLVDKNGDNFYAGTVGGTTAWNEYRLVIEACNSDGCGTKTHRIESTLVDWDDRFGSHRSPVLPK